MQFGSITSLGKVVTSHFMASLCENFDQHAHIIGRILRVLLLVGHTNNSITLIEQSVLKFDGR